MATTALVNFVVTAKARATAIQQATTQELISIAKSQVKEERNAMKELTEEEQRDSGSQEECMQSDNDNNGETARRPLICDGELCTVEAVEETRDKR